MYRLESLNWRFIKRFFKVDTQPKNGWGSIATTLVSAKMPRGIFKPVTNCKKRRERGGERENNQQLESILLVQTFI